MSIKIIKEVLTLVYDNKPLPLVRQPKFFRGGYKVHVMGIWGNIKTRKTFNRTGNRNK